jgi:hypothetical protein
MMMMMMMKRCCGEHAATPNYLGQKWERGARARIEIGVQVTFTLELRIKGDRFWQRCLLRRRLEKGCAVDFSTKGANVLPQGKRSDDADPGYFLYAICGFPVLCPWWMPIEHNQSSLILVLS